MAKHGGIKDSGEYFVINPTTRKVTVPHAHKSLGTVGDRNSEQVTFMCPQIIDGHDISHCGNRFVTWQNVSGEVGHDTLKIVQVEQATEGMIYLAWTIREGLTVGSGIVQFSVHFEDGDSTGRSIYRWSTTTCKDCDILDSVNSVLGAYEAVYLAGDTLVFADYNAVNDGVLSLDSNRFIPKGTKTITENGIYPVGEYAEVDVQVLLHDDPDFVAENIKEGVEILGVTGTYNPFSMLNGTICLKSNDYALQAEVFFAGKQEGENTLNLSNSTLLFAYVNQSEAISASFIKDSWIIINVLKTATDQTVVCSAVGCEIISQNSDLDNIVRIAIKAHNDHEGNIDIEIRDTRAIG